MTSRRARSILVVAAAWLMVSAVATRAEDRPDPTSTSTEISGLVVDSLGQGVAGAAVMVSWDPLSSSYAEVTDWAEITDEYGRFTISDLPPGTYRVTVYYGSGTWTRTGVVAVLEEIAEVNVTIDASASFAEMIEISASAPSIDPTGDSLGVSFSGSTSIENSYTMTIPVPGRTFESALASAPGAAAASQETPAAGLLTASTVDDADRFSEYVDFISRHEAERDELGLNLDRRVRIRVVDAAGQPVNDAGIFVGDGSGVQGRTHADGVWDYFPSENASGTLEVTIWAGGTRIDSFIDVPSHGETDEHLVELSVTTEGLPDALDLAFAIDATGSMGDEMAYLSAELRNIVAEIRDAVPGVSIRVGAVLYRDRQDEVPLTRNDFTADVDGFVDWLGTLSAGGGGDTPEDMNRGLREAMDELAWREGNVARVLVVLADAPPKVYDDAQYRYPDAMRDAAGRGIRLLPVAASGADRTVEYLFRAMGVYTSTPYVYLTDHSGIGNPHLEADTDRVEVERFNDALYRLIVQDLRGEGMHPPGWAYSKPPWQRNPRQLVVGAGVGGGYLFDESFAQLRWARVGIAFGDLELRVQLGWSSDLEVTPAPALKSAGAGAAPAAPIELDVMIAGASLRYLFGHWGDVRGFTSMGIEALTVRTESITDTTHLFTSQLGAEWRASPSGHGLALGVQATSHLFIDSDSRAGNIAPLPPLELSAYADYRF